MKLKIPSNIRALIGVGIAGFLAASIYLDRENKESLRDLNGLVREQLMKTPWLSGLTGGSFEIQEIGRHGDSFESRPAYRLVERISAPKGTFIANVNVVQRNNKWVIFDLQITDSIGKTTDLIRYGKTMKQPP